MQNETTTRRGPLRPSQTDAVPARQVLILNLRRPPPVRPGEPDDQHLRSDSDNEQQTQEQGGGAGARRRRRISWDGGVQDNPKQLASKCCCVFHKKRMFGESDSSSSSSSESDSDADAPGPGGMGSAGGPPVMPSASPDGGLEKRSREDGGAGEGDDCCGHDHDHHHHAVGAEEGQHTMVVKKKKRPKCTKEHCYCGTRFS